ncbi:MAG: PIN domain nuclease [Nocardioides sp.]|nr:PIN domain nuclease [Nocardioides sp.]
MGPTRYLVDKSAYARYGKLPVKQRLRPLVRAGLLAICAAVEVELLHSARSKSDAEQLRVGLRGLDWLVTPDEVWDRAIEVQTLLVGAGNWRAVSMADLVIAAVAERHQVTVMHYDGDFDMIGEVTGQPVEWVVPAGTAD